MRKVATPLMTLALLASAFVVPASANGAPPNNTADNLASCRSISSDDANISVGQCLGFVQTIYLSPEDGWIPHYCDAFQYYEPEAFAALYDDVADCVVENRHN